MSSGSGALQNKRYYELPERPQGKAGSLLTVILWGFTNSILWKAKEKEILTSVTAFFLTLHSCRLLRAMAAESEVKLRGKVVVGVTFPKGQKCKLKELGQQPLPCVEFVSCRRQCRGPSFSRRLSIQPESPHLCCWVYGPVHYSGIYACMNSFHK